MQLFSLTKLITAIAAYQLVDRGVISLDSEEDVVKYLPELGDLPILKGYEADGKPILEKATKRITLRMLLSHQAGGRPDRPVTLHS
jgi:CubicO group peptidase (beta-lactamase class C family)